MNFAKTKVFYCIGWTQVLDMSRRPHLIFNQVVAGLIPARPSNLIVAIMLHTADACLGVFAALGHAVREVVRAERRTSIEPHAETLDAHHSR